MRHLKNNISSEFLTSNPKVKEFPKAQSMPFLTLLKPLRTLRANSNRFQVIEDTISLILLLRHLLY